MNRRLPQALVALVISLLTGQPAKGASFLPTSPMSAAREFHTATLLTNGLVLVAGGYPAGAACELYDSSSGNWAATGSMNYERDSHTATLLTNGLVLVAGGDYVGNTCELFDPVTGTWTLTGLMLTARYDHTACLLTNGLVLVSGGIDVADSATAELYDPASGTWTATGDMTAARSGHTATLLTNGRVLVVAGDDLPRNSAELYDPVLGTWSMTGLMADGRASHTATLLANGLVLVAGGSVALSRPPSAELYDPATGTWTYTGAMTSTNGFRQSTARYRHSATLLTNGLVLVTGGALHDPSFFWSDSSAELFDPLSRNWKSVGRMGTSREHPTATLLPNGQVLIAGGFNNFATELLSAELYLGPPPPIILTGSQVLSDGSFQFSFTNAPGVSFTVLTTTNPALTPGNWTVIGKAIEISPGQFQFNDAAAPNFSQRYYRLRSP